MINRDDSAKLSEPLVVNEFPHAVEERENEWITLTDGVRLAARIWLPTNALTSPVPAILEYLPYRKRDGTATRDALTHPFFAGHGYACIRVDMRGSGESDGLLEGEYLESEQDDALEIIDWLVRQPWCNGNVGMIGISWGGFNGLQVAYRQPDALKAVVTLCSTDDRYDDDIHYKGGALLNENQGWGATMLAYQSRPPDRALRKDWREVWLQRLEAMPLLFHEWLTSSRYVLAARPAKTTIASVQPCWPSAVGEMHIPKCPKDGAWAQYTNSGDHRSLGASVSSFCGPAACYRLFGRSFTMVESVAQRKGYRG